MSELKIVLNPSQIDIDAIETWLEAEFRDTRKGFYTDRDILYQSLKEKTLILLKKDGESVAFIAWKLYSSHVAKISIAETHPNHRKKGYVRALLTGLIKKLQKKAIQVINLNHISLVSEIAWKHLGFIKFPEDDRNSEHEQKELYKVIVPVLNTGTGAGSETIELWHMDGHAISGVDPNVIWNLSFTEGSRMLQKPIVYPAHHNWYLVWKKNGETAYEGRMKRFPVEISFGRFMIIACMP